MTKQQIMQKAQQTANQLNKPVAVLNLNQFSPLYVIREWDDRYIGDKSLVGRVVPATIDQGG
jgi:hypothetical protein